MELSPFLTRRHKIWLGGSLVTFTVLFSTAWGLNNHAERLYLESQSVIMYDRHGVALSIEPNNKGHYVYPTEVLPEEFVALLLRKEDRFFYYHPGVNPVSTGRAVVHFVHDGAAGGASTLTQQLAKNLLGTETKRTVGNKLTELAYTLSLELFHSKADVLTMYANTVYLGNQLQGFETASRAYFDKPLAETSRNEQLALIATLSRPSSRNPWEADNATFAEQLHTQLGNTEPFTPPTVTTTYTFQTDTAFELRTAGITCPTTCTVTVDHELTEALRTILATHIDKEWYRNVRNGAIVIIDPATEELLVFIGSRNPNSQENGDQINLAISSRPIGSTIKPFIYGQGFAAGLRPYSIVDDREYKYSIATGFPLYPKNYDGQYRGEVTLHEALSNSLNVPTVKVLEYVGLQNFYHFLDTKLNFEPIQPYESYQYGIALGGLEMDLLTLTHYFTTFPNYGTLGPLHVLANDTENFNLPPQSHVTEYTEVMGPAITELVHAIISDRLTGVNQFGLESNLNVEAVDYGVKTGTSRDFHDSWVVGYTPDFVVGVWLGNSENKPLKQVSGQSGAGSIWHDVMNYLVASLYYHSRTLTHDRIDRVAIGDSLEWSLPGDIIAEHQNILLGDDLILQPHPSDTFEFYPDTAIPLIARSEVTWSVNGEEIATATETTFTPTKPGTYEIAAVASDRGDREIISIEVTQPE